MSVAHLVRQLGRNDAKLVGRDQFMVGLIAYPVLNVLLLRYGLRPLTDWVGAQYAFDLQPYWGLAVSYLLVVMIPMFVGMVIGLLLIEERDDHTLTAMMVTPVSLNQLVGYRVVLAAVLSFLTLVVAVPATTLVDLSLGSLLPIAALAALNAPVTALLFFAIAQDKVQAFGVLKMLSTLNVLPLVAFFVARPWQYLLGMQPAYWAVKAFWTASASEIVPSRACLVAPLGDCLITSYPLGQLWVWLALGLIYNAALLVILTRRFQQQAYRA